SIDEIKVICDIVYVAGLSMGCKLAMYISERYPYLAGMILINADIELPKMTTYYESKKDKAERFVPGIASDIKNPHVTELAYDKTTVKSMDDLIELTDIMKMNLSKITVMTIIFYTITDH